MYALHIPLCICSGLDLDHFDEGQRLVSGSRWCQSLAANQKNGFQVNKNKLLFTFNM